MKKAMLIVLIFYCVAVWSGSAGAFWGKKDEAVKKEEAVKKAEVKNEAASQSDVVAKVGERKITAKELEIASQKDLMSLATQIYQAKKKRLDQMIEDELFAQEAKKQGKSVEDIKKEVSAPTATLSDDAIEVYYDSNPSRYGGKTLDQVKEEIRQTLINQKKTKNQSQFLAELKKKYPTEVYLEEPKIEIDTTGAPSRGPKDAKVTIVEFSEFQCPFCKKFKPTIDQIVKEYPNDVRHAFRHLPLGFHDKAKGAAKASICADEQGKFWEFRDIAFEKTPAIDEASLKTYAQQIGIDIAKYDACMANPATDKKVEEELVYAAEAGARGTPTSFVNGVLFSGARPYEELKKVVDEKLGKS